MPNLFKVIIQPVRSGDIDSIKTIVMRILGPDSNNKVEDLIENGGTIFEELNEEAASHLATQLREAGAEVEVIPMKNDQGKKQQLFRVRLISYGEKKIHVIKEIRKVTGLGLKESKELVENLGIVQDGVSHKAALKMKAMLEDAGATVTLEPIGESTKSDEFVVYGKVKLPNGEPAGGVLIRAFDRDLRSKELLGEATTQKDGKYRIQYSSEDFSKAEKHGADLIIRVHNELGLPLQAEFSQEGTIFNAGKDEEVNVQILEGEPFVPSEFEQLNSLLTPLLDGASLASLTDEELVFLVHESEINEFEGEFPAGADSIAFLSESAKRSVEAGLPTEAFYGWARQGIGVIQERDEDTRIENIRFDLTKLLEQNHKDLVQKLKDAIEKNIIPSRFAEMLDRISSRIKHLMAQHKQRTRENWTTVEATGKLINADDETPLAGFTLHAFDNDADEDFQDLGHYITDGLGHFTVVFSLSPGIEEANQIRRNIQLQIINQAGVKCAEKELEVVTGLEEPFIVKIKVPAAPEPGENVEIEALPVNLSDEIKDILVHHNVKTLADIRKIGGLRDLRDLPEGLRDTVEIKHLQAHADLSLLSSGLDIDEQVKENQFLINKGFLSAFDIADKTEEHFLKTVNGGSEDGLDHFRALRLHRTSRFQSHQLHNIYINALTGGFRFPELRHSEGSDELQRDPGLNCTCADCVSAISPGAYLTDLAGYISKHVLNKDSGENIDLDFLTKTFHQPLRELPVNCAATKNKVRQVRIACEILYNHIDLPVGDQLTMLMNEESIKRYRLNSYKGLLRGIGISLNDLKRASTDKEIINIANRIGIAREHVDELLLEPEQHQLLVNALSESNLEHIFGLPAFMESWVDVDIPRMRLLDPLRLLNEDKEQPLLYKWRLEYLQEQWRKLDFPEDSYSNGELPKIDPDLIGPDDFREPDTASAAFSIWERRRVWLDKQLAKYRSLIALDENDLHSQLTSLKVLLEEMSEVHTYPPENGQDISLDPWPVATDLDTLINQQELLRKHGEIENGDALDTWLKEKHLTTDTLSTLADIAGRVKKGEELEDEEWIITTDILVQVMKKAFYSAWVEEEKENDIEFDPRIFWVSLTEPKEGPWSSRLEDSRPLIDPGRVEQRDLPDGKIGEKALELWRQRSQELIDKQDKIYTILQSNSADRFEEAMQESLGNPPDPNEPWTSFIDNLNLKLQSQDDAEMQDANRIIVGELFLEKEGFERLVSSNILFADTDKKLNDNTQKLLVSDLVSAHKQKKLYPDWTEEEVNHGLRYWQGLKARIPKWRGGLQARQIWRQALETRSQPPIIDPDIVNGMALANPVPGEAAFDLWRQRSKMLETEFQTIDGFDISDRAGLSDLFVTYLGVSLEKLIQIGLTEKDGKPINKSLEQLNLSRDAYLLLIEVARRFDEGKTVLDETLRDVRNIILQVWKRRHFAEWRREEQGKVSVSLGLFKLPTNRFNFNDTENPHQQWRIDLPRQREWLRTLRARIEQKEELAASLKELVSSVEEQTLPDLRDSLINIIDESDAILYEKAEKLADRFLIDMQLSGCQTTTRVANAIEVLQTLVFSIRSGKFELGNEIHLELQSKNFDKEWQWMGSYATWKAAMGVFLYPEQVLLPSLLREQTPAFRKLMEEIRTSGKFTSKEACASVSRYLEYLDDVRKIEVDATCFAKTAIRESIHCGSRVLKWRNLLHLFGKGGNFNGIYVSTYDIEDKRQTHWTPVISTNNVIDIVGVAKHENYLLLFMIINEGDKDALYLYRQSLVSGRWEEPIALELPDKTRLISARIVEQINEEFSPVIAINLQPTDNPNKFSFLLLKRLNESRLGWESDVGDWQNNVGSGLGVGSFSSIIVSVVETEDGFFVFWEGGSAKEGHVEYLEKGINDHRDFTLLSSSYSKNLNTKIVGAFRYPDSDEVYAIEENGTIRRFFIGERRVVSDEIRTNRTGPEDTGGLYETFTIIDEEYGGFLYIGKGNISGLAVHTGGYPDKKLYRTISKKPGDIHPNNNKNSFGSFICELESDPEFDERIDESKFISDRQSIRLTPFLTDQFKNDNGALAFNTVFELSPDLNPYFRFMLRVSSDFFLKANTTDNVDLVSYIAETYYYVPLTVAIALSTKGNYDDALHWFNRIYDYSGLNVSEQEFNRFGLTFDSHVVYQGLIVSNEFESFKRDRNWLIDPINPHHIANKRSNAYKNFTIHSILRCILDYADSEFTFDTSESLARARILYEEAVDLIQSELPPPPHDRCQDLVNSFDFEVDDPTLVPVWKNILSTLGEIDRVDVLQERIIKIKEILEGSGNEETKLTRAMKAAEAKDISVLPDFSLGGLIERTSIIRNRIGHQLTGLNPVANSLASIRDFLLPASTNSDPEESTELESTFSDIEIEFSPNVIYSFCVPPNPTARLLLLRAETNLFKIRNCMNIAGMRRELEPYAVPIDVESALPSLGAGGQIRLTGINRIRPTQYRYSVLIERAKQTANLAHHTEQSFFSILQAKDQEAYNLFKARQDVALSREGVKLQKLRLNEAEDGVELAELQLERSSIIEVTYAEWLSEGMLEQEKELLKAYTQFGSAQIDAANWRYMGQVTQAMVSAASADYKSAGAAFAAYAVAVATAVSELNSTTNVILAQGNVNEIALNLSIELRNRGYELQHQIAQKDIEIGSQQIMLAEDRVKIVEQEQEMAQLQVELASDVVSFLQNKFTSVELYNWMSGVLENIFRYYLHQGASMAKLAEVQLSFERQEPLFGVIQNDYYVLPNQDGNSLNNSEDSGTDRRGLTGSARLLRDITKLDQHAFTTDQRKQQLSANFSLAQLDPFAFQQFRERGILTFDTPMKAFDRRFPGQYLRLIKRVHTSVIALVPPVQGISATLSSSGISRVVIGGDVFQTTVIRRDPETISFTSTIGSSGVFELNPNPEMLFPFEGNGVDTRWEFRMPKAANSFDYNSIADVILTIEYTALFNFTYQRQVQSELDPYVSTDRAFSFRQQFADAWYDLNNPDQTSTPMSVSLDTRREDFPANIEDVSISQILLYFVSNEELPEALTAKLTLSQNGVRLGGEANPIEGVISTRRGNGSSWIPIIGKTPEGKWRLTLPDNEQIKTLFKDETIRDILFVITYSGKIPGWPE